jgi:hypothetical protein
MRSRIQSSWLVVLSLGFGTPGWAGDFPCEASSVPSTLYVVGVTAGGQPDIAGQATIVVRHFGQPVANQPVMIDFSDCCDIDLCTAAIDGQTVDCSAGTVSGVTDANGAFTFTVMGAARDAGALPPPAQVGGCGSRGARVFSVCPGQGLVVLGAATVVTLDLNGAAGGSNGTTISDVANALNLFGSVALGAPYRGRGDINADGNLTLGDVGALLRHMGRLGLNGGAGCPAAFCGTPACP